MSEAFESDSPVAGPKTLSIIDIAAWQLSNIHVAKQNIIAGIPSLQRGAVWKAGQVEMLWDSILRGFPIGALVVCEKIKSQGTHSGKYGSGKPDDALTHHLLDGQQRCDAIALGFVDALEPAKETSGDPSATLWIDLAPEMPKGTTRQFLFRMLTKAHPWGYDKDDGAGYLGVDKIRLAVERYGCGKRPKITKAWPQESTAPIPFAWLTEAVLIKKLTDTPLWEHIRDKCLSVPLKETTWAAKAAEKIENYLKESNDRKHLTHIARIGKGLEYAKRLAIIAMEVPADVLNERAYREGEGPSTGANKEEPIYNVEQLFQRLNSAGTVLSGEELMFSMVKAYWPGLENSFNALKDGSGNPYRPMPGSRLAALAARAAFFSLPPGNHKLPPPLNIGKIRSMANASDEKAKNEKKGLEDYLGISHIGRNEDANKSGLHTDLRQIDKWLLFNRFFTNDYGLPAVLRSSLAQRSHEVFLLLLFFAQKARQDGMTDDERAAIRKPIIGLATTIHWFGDDGVKAVESLYSYFAGLEGKLMPNSFAGSLKHCFPPPGGKRELLYLLTPEQLGKMIPSASESDKALSNWTFHERIFGTESDPGTRASREYNEGYFLWRTLKCKAMLLYAQRAFLNHEFGDYDPSCIDISEGKNRPWDYDHILAAATLRSNPGTFRNACKQWGDTIGNFRAWALEKNRSRRDELANESISSPEDIANSFLTGETEINDFSLTWTDVDKASKASAFMNAARGRLIRIYADWFKSLDISFLLLDSNPPPAGTPPS